MGMFGGIGDIFKTPAAGDVLKAVTNPVGTAGAAVGGLLKQSGILDDLGKLLDGGLKKPKGTGLSGISESIKKVLDGMPQPGGPPKGLLPPPGLGGLAEKIRKMVEQMPMPSGGGKTMPSGYGGGKSGSGYGGQGGGYGGGKAGGGYGGQAGGYGGGKAGGGYGGGGGGYGGGYGGAASGAIGGLAMGMQKAIFISTLQKVIQDVASKPQFDMNRAINEVWMQVSMLRAQQQLKEMTEAMNLIEGMMKAQHDMAKGIVGNLR